MGAPPQWLRTTRLLQRRIDGRERERKEIALLSSRSGARRQGRSLRGRQFSARAMRYPQTAPTAAPIMAPSAVYRSTSDPDSCALGAQYPTIAPMPSPIAAPTTEYRRADGESSAGSISAEDARRSSAAPWWSRGALDVGSYALCNEREANATITICSTMPTSPLTATSELPRPSFPMLLLCGLPSQPPPRILSPSPAPHSASSAPARARRRSAPNLKPS